MTKIPAPRRPQSAAQKPAPAAPRWMSWDDWMHRNGQTAACTAAEIPAQARTPANVNANATADADGSDTAGQRTGA